MTAPESRLYWRAAGRKTKVKERGPLHYGRRDKAYDTADHVAALRALNVTPHVAQYDSGSPTGRRGAVDSRTRRHEGYGMSQCLRRGARCANASSGGASHGTMRKIKHRSVARVAGDFLRNLIAYDLVRLSRLIAAESFDRANSRLAHPAEPLHTDMANDPCSASRCWSGRLWK